MNKQKVFSYVSILLAEWIALLYDTRFRLLPYQAARYFQSNAIFSFGLIPFLAMGILIGLCFAMGRKANLLKLFLGLLIFNLALVAYQLLLPLKYHAVILFGILGILFMLGVSIVGILYSLACNRKKH